MSSTVNLKAIGLNFSPNNLSLPDGSLTEASNVIVRRDAVIESRRGLRLYGTPLPDVLDRIKQLLTYRDRILRHFNTTLQFDSDGQGTFLNFSGSYTETAPGLRIKSIESNGNLYFTTLDGIKKISARTAADFTTASGYITNAGGVKAIDFTAKIIPPQTSAGGFLPQDGAVAYRTVWGTRDINNNLILGTPSDPVAVYNRLTDLLAEDFVSVLEALDLIKPVPSTSFFEQGDYVNTFLSSPYNISGSSNATELGTAVVALAAKIDSDIVFATDTGTFTEPDATIVAVPLTISAVAASATDVVRVTFSSGDPTNYFLNDNNRNIFLSGFGVGSTSGTIINGGQLINNVTSTYIEFNVTGAVTAETFAFVGSVINSNEYRSITPLPNIPGPIETDADLVSIQVYLESIITHLQSEPVTIIPAVNQTAYITPLEITRTSNVRLTVRVPQEVTAVDFLQIYRSATVVATGASNINDLIPNGNEVQLVYEAYPTSAEIAARVMIVDDITPDFFKGANLYTNASTGEGILQANDVPPFAKDINRFKNVIFYANTRTRHRIVPFSLLGVSNMIADYNAGIIPTITIANSTTSNTYTFVTGEYEVSEVTTVADVADSLNGKYFNIYSANDETPYYVWYKTSGGTAADPTIPGKFGIRVNINTGETAIGVAEKTKDTMALYLGDFKTATSEYSFTVSPANATAGAIYTNNGYLFKVVTSIVAGTTLSTIGPFNSLPEVSGDLIKVSGTGDDTITYSAFVATTANNLYVTNVNVGYATDISDGAGLLATGFTFSVKVQGQGESIANKQILLSQAISVAQAIDETSRSFIRVINANPVEIISVFYTSSLDTAPGKMLLEARILSLDPFYIIANDSNTGSSFNPDISPVVILPSSPGRVSATNPTTITSTAHGLINNDKIIITNSDSTPSINGVFTVTVTGPNTFTIPVNVTIAGTQLSYSKLSDAEVSQNEVKPNRIYYSKLQQPEAVPVVNFIDVGAENKGILRIFPLRDSLFIFKEDGLYRISGEIAPFYLSLFDSSCLVVAPDSVSVCNNIVYGFTRQGISTVTEAGVITVSRPIDTEIQKISSDNYPAFSTATWGVGYESDNSYLVATVKATTDEQATIIYRYSNLTNSWTTFDKEDTCGIVNSFDDKLYMGAGDTNYIEQERKTFTRLDYADREIGSTISINTVTGQQIRLADVTQFDVGDVVVQEQLLTVSKFNSLLQKLDFDPSVATTNITAISQVGKVLTITAPNHNLSPSLSFVTIVNNTSTNNFNGTYPAIYIDSNNFRITVTLPVTSLIINGAARLNYLNTLKAVNGDQLRTSIERLALKLDTDPDIVFTNYASIIATKTGAITSISADSPTIITSAGHGLQNGRYVTITGSNSMPNINGNHIVTVTGANTFTIPVAVNTAGTTGTFTTVNDNFIDIQACFNAIVENLNNDNGVSFSNYNPSVGVTIEEAVVDSVDRNVKALNMIIPIDWIVGPITVFKAIDTNFTYAPSTFQDPLGLKHISESTIMFDSKEFTIATLSFATDLLPAFNEVEFFGDGNGIFGFDKFGDNFFGGVSHPVPFRTYIPRNCQRCRYIVVRFSHFTAREKYSVYGITLTGEIGQSTRAYR